LSLDTDHHSEEHNMRLLAALAVLVCLTLAGFSTMTAEGIRQNTVKQRPKQSNQSTKAEEAVPTKTFTYNSDFHVGDCTTNKGAKQFVRSDGSWGHDADVKSSDTNDVWECWFSFKNAAGAQIWESNRRIFKMNDSDHLYHWHIDIPTVTALKDHFNDVVS
jgi:hypothetical protein